MVHGNFPQRIGAQPRNLHGLRNADMRAGRGISAKPLSHARLLRFGSQYGGARHQNGEQVCHRCAGDEYPAGAQRKPEHLARPSDDLALHFHRHVIAPAEIGVQSARQHFGQHTHRRAAAMHPAHETGMHIARRIRHDVIGELLIGVFQFGRLARQGGTKMRARRVGNGLPHRALADMFDVIDHVVEHAMPQGAQRAPILGIEGGTVRFDFLIVQAARARDFAARSYSIAVKASKTLCICAGL